MLQRRKRASWAGGWKAARETNPTFSTWMRPPPDRPDVERQIGSVAAKALKRDLEHIRRWSLWSDLDIGLIPGIGPVTEAEAIEFRRLGAKHPFENQGFAFLCMGLPLMAKLTALFGLKAFAQRVSMAKRLGERTWRKKRIELTNEIIA